MTFLLGFTTCLLKALETQTGLNTVLARSPLMKDREVFLNPARVPDRQLCCVNPLPLPTPKPPAARLRLGVAEQGRMEIRRVNRITAWLPSLLRGHRFLCKVCLCTVPLPVTEAGHLPFLQVYS